MKNKNNRKIKQPKILTIDAEKLFYYYIKKPNKANTPFCFDTRNRLFYRQVVKQIDDFDECPLLYQIMELDTFKKDDKESKTDIFVTDDWLLDKLIIIDFSKVFVREINPDNSSGKKREESLEKARDLPDHSSGKKRDKLLEKAQDLIENGLDVTFSNEHTVHMIPFDKSGNMSRTGRITFLNEAYQEELNQRLNLDMDFTKLKVVLSKYYAYRGLYLTSSQRVENKELKITPETLVVVKDNRKYWQVKNKRWAEVLGPRYERNVPIITLEEETSESSSVQKWKFTDQVKKEMEYVETPFDGEGLISPEYAKLINGALRITGASSFQVRMPFVKGMLHQVDFHQFLEENDREEWEKNDSYEYEDAFGVTRNLKKAKILITESMFKCKSWLKAYCDQNKIADPMEYYCKKIQKYNHGLYISGTDLPYGNSEYTHLTYQMINTLDFKDEEFNKVIKKHCSFIDNPREYLTRWDASEANDFEKPEIFHEEPTWKKAIKDMPEFEKDSYIAEQLGNTAKGLITKIANGKLVVSGQTRFLCRDLMPMLACLIKNPYKAKDFYPKCLFMRFYMPMGDGNREKELKVRYRNLRCNGYCAFFRSPHLSRNEQCLLQPFTVTSARKNDFYYREKDWRTPEEEKYIEYVNLYQKYFGHLTGVVMVPRGSIVPLCLGGADFDGDLVNVVYDENVVEAVRRGCYEKWLNRKMPVIKIPSPKPKEETVPKTVPFEHINNTFSNAIGYLSNTAIAIGQEEYAGDKKNDSNNGKNKPACWKCTALTGLEIDAAKNGKHPDLSDVVLDKELFPPSTYINFKDKYEYFRTLSDFKFDKMELGISKEEGSAQDVISFNTGAENAKTYECNIAAKNYGTKINMLPYIFVEEYTNYSNNIAKRKTKLAFPFEVFDDDKQMMKDYQKACGDVVDLFFAYKSLAGSLRFEKNKIRYGEKNLTKLIAKKYDTEQDAKINDEIVFKLINKFNMAIPYDQSLGEVRERLNTEKWQFQPYKKRGETLEKIIGNGFTIESLDKAEKNLLFHFGQYGYKMLWHLLTAVKDIRIRSYEEIKDSNKSIKAKHSITLLPELTNELEIITKEYYENNLTKVEERLYSACLIKIRDITKESKLSTPVKINALYERLKKNSSQARFFWDVFSWEEIKACIPENKEVISNAE